MSGPKDCTNDRHYMTIGRALAELKTINKRIAKITNDIIFASTYIAGRPWNDHTNSTVSNFQAVNDLMDRYNKIKCAVIRSNADTIVTISGKTYTVAEAIAKKESIRHQKELLAKARHYRLKVDKEMVDHNQLIQSKLDDLLRANFGRNKESDDSDVKSITDAYLKNNRIEKVDPLNLEKMIPKMEDEIADFEKEVDFILSESNAITKIYVS